MKVQTNRLFPPEYRCYYLFGEDQDALFEAAEGLLAWEAADAQLLRVDVDELARIEVASRSQSLFGNTACHALVRNAGNAKPKQIEHLCALMGHSPERLILCAANMDSRKALHKKIMAMNGVACCSFVRPTSSQFQAWLHKETDKAGFTLTPEAMMLFSERMDGLRQSSRQAIERMSWYDDEQHETLNLAVVGDLLGERSPSDLDAYCAAVATRSPHALSILRHLLRDERVSEVQALVWVSMRLQQLLMYTWYRAKDARTATSKARLFGAARNLVPKEAGHWSAGQIIHALGLAAATEMQLKGASVEDKAVVLERMTLALVSEQSA